MASTTFIDGTTVIVADWLNDINDLFYDYLGAPASLDDIKAILDVDDLPARMTATESATATNTSNISTNTSNISTNTTDIATNASDIATLSASGTTYTIVAVGSGATAITEGTFTLFNVDTTSGAATLSLPAAVDGRIYTIKKSDISTNTITITPDGAETIDLDASATLVGTLKPSVTLVGIAGTGWVNI
jgi:hypothetical protein